MTGKVVKNITEEVKKVTDEDVEEAENKDDMGSDFDLYIST